MEKTFPKLPGSMGQEQRKMPRPFSWNAYRRVWVGSITGELHHHGNGQVGPITADTWVHLWPGVAGLVSVLARLPHYGRGIGGIMVMVGMEQVVAAVFRGPDTRTHRIRAVEKVGEVRYFFGGWNLMTGVAGFRMKEKVGAIRVFAVFV